MEAAALPGPMPILCSVLSSHRDRDCFAPADRHCPYHQHDDQSSNDAEAAHDDNGHTILRKAWWGQGRLQSVLWRRGQQLGQLAGHRSSTSQSRSHPLSFRRPEVTYRIPIYIHLTPSVLFPGNPSLLSYASLQQVGLSPSSRRLPSGIGHGCS